jgi:hypothetical protein
MMVYHKRAKSPIHAEPRQLYHIVVNNFESIDQFLLAIDVLYVLGRIEVNFQTRTVIYAS